MKLKYYLRGLGIGIIVTTIILTISFSGRKEEISDEEVIARATQLGMVMQEEETKAEETENSGKEATQAVENTKEEVTETQAVENSGRGETETQEPEQENASGEPEASGVDMDQNVAVPEGETGMFRLTIQKGDVCRVVCEKLAEGGVITDSEALRKYLFEIGYASNMSVGQYDIPYGASNEEIAEILQKGPVE